MRAGLFDRRDGAAGDDPDAVLLHVDAQMLAHVVVEAAQDVFAAIDQRHLGAEAGKDAGEFDRDIAAALDHDAARQLRQMERLVRRDGVLDAGNFVAIARRAAGRDQDVRRALTRSPFVTCTVWASASMARLLTTLTPDFSRSVP